MIFHQTHPHSHPPGHRSRLEVRIVRSCRRTGQPDRAGLRKMREVTWFLKKTTQHMQRGGCRICQTSLMSTASPGCQGPSSTKLYKYIFFFHHSLSDELLPDSPSAACKEVVARTHRSHTNVAGYLCQTNDEETFIRLFAEKLLRGIVRGIGGNAMCWLFFSLTWSCLF